MATDQLFPYRDREYFEWLCGQVATPAGAGSYEDVMLLMFDMSFIWLVPNDENRVADGLEVRLLFNADKGYKEDIRGVPVCFLEVLIGLSRRFAFLVDRHPADCAWDLMKNLKLGGFHDPLRPKEVRKVTDILETATWRRYGRDGSGGFFPLTRPKNDQREVEIWYQMTAYIEENRESFGL